MIWDAQDFIRTRIKWGYRAAASHFTLTLIFRNRLQDGLRLHKWYGIQFPSAIFEHLRPYTSNNAANEGYIIFNYAYCIQNCIIFKGCFSVSLFIVKWANKVSKNYVSGAKLAFDDKSGANLVNILPRKHPLYYIYIIIL